MRVERVRTHAHARISITCCALMLALEQHASATAHSVKCPVDLAAQLAGRRKNSCSGDCVDAQHSSTNRRGRMRRLSMENSRFFRVFTFDWMPMRPYILPTVHECPVKAIPKPARRAFLRESCIFRHNMNHAFRQSINDLCRHGKLCACPISGQNSAKR